MLKAKQLLVTHKTVLLLFPSSNTDGCTHCQNWQLFTIRPITHAITPRLKTSSLICVTLSCSGWGDLILIGLLFKSCFLQKLGDKLNRWPDKMLAVQKSSRWISGEKKCHSSWQASCSAAPRVIYEITLSCYQQPKFVRSDHSTCIST